MVPFHQYQRYKMVEIIFNGLNLQEEELNILEVGANEHKNLEKFLHKKQIKYLDLILAPELLEDPSFVEGDATNLDFPDGEFDFVIGLDVLEHIPKNKREAFLNEIERVSKYGFIISAPFTNHGVEELEERLGFFFNFLYDGDILWSKEHRENGLPEINGTLNTINKFIGKSVNFKHSSSILFEKLMQMEFKSGLNPKASSYWKAINQYYNENLFFKDFDDEHSVRNFIIYGKNGFESKIQRVPSLIKDLTRTMTKEDEARLLHFEQTINFMCLQKVEELEEKQNNHSDVHLQIYWNENHGFNENDSYSMVLNKQQSIYEVDLDLVSDSSQVRIDPSPKGCIIKLLEVELFDQAGNRLNNYDVQSNSFLRLKDQFIFLEDDPQIIFESKVSPIKRIKLIIQYINDDLFISDDIVNQLLEIKHIEAKKNSILEKIIMRNKKYKNETKNLKIKKNEYEEQINELRNQLVFEKENTKEKTMKLDAELNELHKQIELLKKVNNDVRNENDILIEKMNTRIVRLSNKIYKFIGKLRGR
ncbi:hypothetical protein PAECIP112173_04982 [Paenibacillus sp. JJ-100]|uniref:class I SAM-dependent methyltransferase n=1 Tax=Paenibacillus sp. JJ-100 TaxID=2974896 RepID=UPI0022FFBBB5|nr:methyltransferase domain-containing protein [Paenibacillus sp. JJ-100]CAI6086426.1 hypothetical protein PAECIP112173_04982 [Paenibacillus sp. JJ-100]